MSWSWRRMVIVTIVDKTKNDYHRNSGYRRKNWREKTAIVKTYCKEEHIKRKVRKFKVKEKVKRGKPINTSEKTVPRDLRIYEVE